MDVDKPFVCDYKVCEISFKKKGDLTRHQMIQEKNHMNVILVNIHLVNKVA